MNQKNSSEKKKVSWPVILVVIIVLFNVLSETDLMFLLPLAIPIIIFWIVYRASKKSSGKKENKPPQYNYQQQAAKPGYTYQQQAAPTAKHEPHHMNRRQAQEAAVTEKVYAPAAPQPQKQYYDSSDVFDSYERDKKRRIQQLDSFLKNGIIDKNEYNVLMKKYESVR